MDNEQFTLHAATDSSFYACTADEEFSCVFEIFPEDRSCEPTFSVKGPILKIDGNGSNTLMLIDDSIVHLDEDRGVLGIIYQADNITDIAVTPMGLMVGTTDGILWLTGPETGTMIETTPVQALWWDNSDVLYYLTADADLIAVSGIRERFQELTAPAK